MSLKNKWNALALAVPLVAMSACTDQQTPKQDTTPKASAKLVDAEIMTQLNKDGLYKLSFSKANDDDSMCLVLRESQIVYERGYMGMDCTASALQNLINAEPYKIERLYSGDKLTKQFKEGMSIMTLDAETIGRDKDVNCVVLKEDQIVYERGYLSMACDF